jgi:pyrroloquinoline quinone biosynthesis protein E
MPEPCSSCEFREVDWGGCRCQALAFAGDAALTDPACAKSSLHDAFSLVAEREAALPAPELVFRNPRAGTQL